MSFTCPRCKRTSHNPNDEANGYCGNCHEFVPRVEPLRFTYRQWLTMQACLAGAPIMLAIEAVASTALEHPEWDLDEVRTWQQWEAWEAR